MKKSSNRKGFFAKTSIMMIMIMMRKMYRLIMERKTKRNRQMSHWVIQAMALIRFSEVFLMVLKTMYKKIMTLMT